VKWNLDETLADARVEVEIVLKHPGGLSEELILKTTNSNLLIPLQPEVEFKEFYPRLKFKPRLKYSWFHLKLYSMFQDLSRCLVETGFW